VLKLHHTPEKKSGVVLSLRPIQPKKRPLLKKALAARLAEKKAASDN
jgi:hypothetical protein